MARVDIRRPDAVIRNQVKNDVHLGEIGMTADVQVARSGCFVCLGLAVAAAGRPVIGNLLQRNGYEMTGKNNRKLVIRITCCLQVDALEAKVCRAFSN